MNEYFCKTEAVILGHGKIPLTQSPFTFTLPSGSLTALIGRNGSGKTTFLQSLLGEKVLLSGDIFLFDSQINVRDLNPTLLSQHLAFVPQEHIYPPDLTLKQLLHLAYLPRMGMFGKMPPKAEREVQAMLSFFSLGDLRNRPLKSLSTGERQKAFLGRALLQKPNLLILDEPTNHLDPAAVHSFWSLLLKQKQTMPLDILVSTHDMNFVQHHCQWVCALEKGNLFYNGPKEEFLSSQKLTELFGIF